MGRPWTRWEAIDCTGQAIELRALVFGYDARPRGKLTLAKWSAFVRRWSFHPLFKAQARLVGSDVQREGERLLPTPANEDRLLGMYSARMCALPPYVAPARAKGLDAASKQALLDGLCPVCAEALPCACGTPKVEPDGKGGLRARAPE